MNRALAREIRSLSLGKLRGSRALWKEYKRTRPSFSERIRRGSGTAGFFYIAAILIVLVQRGGPKAPLLVLALYSAATIAGRSNALFGMLYQSGDLAFFMHVPVTDSHFFTYAWRKFLKSSLSVLFFSLLAFGYLAVTSKAGLMGWSLAVIAATLQWLLIVTLVVSVRLFLPSWSSKIEPLLYAITAGAVFLPESWATPSWRAIRALPTAWIPYIFEHGALDRELGSLYLLILIAACLLIFLPLVSRRLRKHYPAAELTYPPTSRAAVKTNLDYGETLAVKEDDWQSTKPHETSLLRVDPADLGGLDWNTPGWIENLAGRLLNEREKKAADFLCGGQLGLWSMLWRRGLKIASVGVIALLLPNLLPLWIGIAVGVFSSAFALPLLGGPWEGMQLVPDSGKVRPACSGIPLSYTEMSCVLAKINLLRYGAWVPIVLVYGAILGWRLQMAPLLGVKVAAEILLALLSLQPMLIVGRHAYGTNDTRRLNLHSILAILVVGSLGIAYAGCLTAVFVATEWAPEGSRVVLAALAATGALLCSLLIWSSYKLFYNRGRMDTMREADR